MVDKVLYLDDLKLGDQFVSETVEISKEEIIDFAHNYDPQDFHTDEEKAKDTFFKGLSASGWNTASKTMKLIVESVPFAHGIIGMGVDLDWPNPTRPGDNITATSTIADIKYSKSKPNQGIVFLQTVATNQDGKELVIINSKLLNFVKEK